MPLTAAELAAAREIVGAHVPRSPALRWPLLEQVTGTETWVKHENHNPTGTFKVRGGLAFVAHLLASQPGVPGLIGATRGNHGQSIAYAGAAHGLVVTIVVPEGNSPDKNAAMAGFGAELVVHGHDYQASREYAEQVAAEQGLVMVPPYHLWLAEGVATLAAELHEDVPGLDTIYVPVGMGSGICAQILVRDLLGLETEIVGVLSDRAPAYSLSFEAGEPVATASADTFVDGVACRVPDAEAVAIINAGAARLVQVSDEAVAAAMVTTYSTTHNLAEPAGAIALAGLLAERDLARGKRVAVIQTGGNCDYDILERVMKEHG
jgi:threonine dehydratase